MVMRLATFEAVSVSTHTIQLAHDLLEVVLQSIICCDKHIQAVLFDHFEVFCWIDIPLEQDAARGMVSMLYDRIAAIVGFSHVFTLNSKNSVTIFVDPLILMAEAEAEELWAVVAWRAFALILLACMVGLYQLTQTGS